MLDLLKLSASDLTLLGIIRNKIDHGQLDRLTEDETTWLVDNFGLLVDAVLDLESLTGEIDDLRADLTESESETERLREESLDWLKDNFRTVATAALNCARLENDLDFAQAESRAWEALAKEVAEEVASLRAENSDLKAELTNANDIIASLEEELSNLRANN